MTAAAWKTLLLLLLLALVVRLAAGVWWQGRLPDETSFSFPDSESYWMLAGKLASGEPYQTNPDRRIFRTPGYPALLAVLFRIHGQEPPVIAARFLGAVLGTVTVAGIGMLAWLLFGRGASILATLAAALYPGAIAMSTFVLSEAAFCPLMILQMILCVLAWRSKNAKRRIAWACGAGAVAALATLTRPSWLLFTPFALTVALLFFPDRRRSAWLGLCMIVAFCVTMAPWWVRNWQITGSFVPTTLQVGESLYDGLNPHARGASDMRFVDRFRQQLRDEDAVGKVSHSRCFEQRLDQRMRDAAIAWAMENPAAALRLAGVKFVRMWNVWPNEPSMQSWRFGVVVLLGYTPLLITGLCGAWKFGGRGWVYALCLLPAIYFSGLHAVFVGSIRYRQPAMLALIVLTAGAVSPWIEGDRVNDRESL